MSAIWTWFVGLWTWLARLFDQPYKFQANEGTFPKRLEKRRIYILTEDGDPWEAKLVCPCGCGEVLELNLIPDDHPTWKATADAQGRATLHPSVWRHIGCQSHFWVRGGRIIWV